MGKLKPEEIDPDFLPTEEEDDLYFRLRTVQGFTGDPDKDAENPEIQKLIQEFKSQVITED